MSMADQSRKVPQPGHFSLINPSGVVKRAITSSCFNTVGNSASAAGRSPLWW